MKKTISEPLVGGLLAFILGFMLVWLSPARATELAPAPVTPRDALFHPHWDRAHCGSVCTISFSPGGVIKEYLDQVRTIKRDHVTLRIDGPCISACTMVADKARSNVCITPNATLQFHQGIAEYGDPETHTVVRKERFDPSEYYSADINGWVAAHGGFPGKDTSPEEMRALLVMSFDEAKHFFKVCK